MQSKFCSVDSCKFGNPTDHLHWQNCHTKQEFAPSAFHKGMPTEIGSRFEPLVATEEWAAQLRSWTACAHVPVLLPQILGAFAGLLPWHSWGRLQRCSGPKGRVSYRSYTACLAAHLSVGTRWWRAAQPPPHLAGSSADTPESLHQEHSTKRKHQDLGHWFETEIVIKNCFHFK